MYTYMDDTLIQADSEPLLQRIRTYVLTTLDKIGLQVNKKKTGEVKDFADW